MLINNIAEYIKLEAQWAEPVSLTFHSVLRKHTKPSKVLPTKFLFIWPIRNKNWMWWPRLWTDRDEKINRYNWSSIDTSYQVWVHLGKRLQRRIIFRNRPIRNKNCMSRPCLLTGRDEMNILIDDISYTLPTRCRFISPCGFRGEDFQKSTNQKQELPFATMFFNELGRNEQSV